MTKRALILGATGGIGAALAKAMDREGWEVIPLSRSTDGLDFADPAAVDHLLSAQQGPFERILVATGALDAGYPPEKALRQVDAAALAIQFQVNAIGPALVLRHAARLMPRDAPAIFAALSARVGSIADNRLGGWYGYRAAKAALNQILRSAAIELARTHPKAACLALHPGTVSTTLTRHHGRGHPQVTPDEAARNLLSVIDGIGPADSGTFLDWKGDRIPW